MNDDPYITEVAWFNGSRVASDTLAPRVHIDGNPRPPEAKSEEETEEKEDHHSKSRLPVTQSCGRRNLAWPCACMGRFRGTRYTMRYVRPGEIVRDRERENRYEDEFI